MPLPLHDAVLVFKMASDRVLLSKHTEMMKLCKIFYLVIDACAELKVDETTTLADYEVLYALFERYFR